MELFIRPLEAEPPFDPQAMVFEQDRELILRLDREVVMPAASCAELIEADRDAPRFEPGSVVVQGREPARFMAVVHDLESDPTWRERWVADAYRSVFATAAINGVSKLALPLLGTVHGRLAAGRSVGWLVDAMTDNDAELECLWIVCEPDFLPEDIAERLRELGV